MGLTSARLRERRILQPAPAPKPRSQDPQEHVRSLRAECAKLRAENARLVREIDELTKPAVESEHAPEPEPSSEPVVAPAARPAPEVIQARPPASSWQNKQQPKRRG